jgi:hypothetical protein
LAGGRIDSYTPSQAVEVTKIHNIIILIILGETPDWAFFLRDEFIMIIVNQADE